MYTSAISLLGLGALLLILNILFFFNDYKETVVAPAKKKMLYVNGLVIFSSLGVIILSTIYIFMINNQLG